MVMVSFTAFKIRCRYATKIDMKCMKVWLTITINHENPELVFLQQDLQNKRLFRLRWRYLLIHGLVPAHGPAFGDRCFRESIFSIPACLPPPPPCPVMHAHVDPRARLLHSASGEILTRLWCLLIVPLGDWDARRGWSPWWQRQPSPWRQPLTHKNTGEGEKRRTGGESWWRST